jgi:hypothetical protein
MIRVQKPINGKLKFSPVNIALVGNAFNRVLTTIKNLALYVGQSILLAMSPCSLIIIIESENEAQSSPVLGRLQ